MSGGDYLARDEEQIKAENERLKAEVNQLAMYSGTNIEIMARLSLENEQLRQALRKCSPYTFPCHDFGSAYEKCKICNELRHKGHKEDCEYIKLTKGEE